MSSKYDEKKYPCADCGYLRTEAQGGRIFTVCDDCWDKSMRRKEKASQMRAVAALKKVGSRSGGKR